MKTKPNILVAIADDWAWPHAGAYGCRFARTPAFDRVAREGVLFQNAFTTAPTCTASRASLLTGRHPWTMEAGAQLWGCLPRRYEAYPDVLARAGYWVGLTNKGWGPGSLEAAGRARNPAGPAFNARRCTPLTSKMMANDYAANFEDFLDQRPADAPFCFWYGAKEPHRGYEKGSGLKHGKRLDEVEVPPYLPDCEAVRSDLLDYALEVERYDRDLGRMLDLIEARGELDDTVVVVTGDNGMPFPRAKANIYENGCHIPLAIRGPGVSPGRTVTDFASFVDLAPTLYALTGVAGPAGMNGRSLADVLADVRSGRVDPARDAVLTGRERHAYSRPGNLGYPMRSIVADDYLYIRNFEPDRWPAGDPERYSDCDDGPTKQVLLANRESEAARFALCFGKRPAEELYRRTPDAGCLQNLATDPACRPVLETLRARLDEALRAIGDPRIAGRGWEFDCVPFIRAPDRGHPPGYPPLDLAAWQDAYIPEGETSRFDRN